jgi:hypothetical protein
MRHENTYLPISEPAITPPEIAEVYVVIAQQVRF